LNIRGKEAEHWNRVAKGWFQKGYSNELLAEHKRKTYLNLIARWADVTLGQRILKTDLFAEAFGAEEFLFDIAKVNGNTVGIDISNRIVNQAKRNAKHHGIDANKYLCGDVKQLPFQNNSIDLIISDSTLDHFHSEADIITALKELGRVLRVGGTLILTMDNKGKLGEPLRRLWILLGLAPFFIGKTYSIKELKSVLQGIGFSVEDTTAIIHQPILFLKLIVRFLHKLSARRFDPLIKKVLVSQDTLEKRRTKYLTGLYIAVKAVKVESP